MADDLKQIGRGETMNYHVVVAGSEVEIVESREDKLDLKYSDFASNEDGVKFVTNQAEKARQAQSELIRRIKKGSRK